MCGGVGVGARRDGANKTKSKFEMGPASNICSGRGGSSSSSRSTLYFRWASALVMRLLSMGA